MTAPGLAELSHVLAAAGPTLHATFLAYWAGLRVVLIAAALIITLSSLDDAFIDLLYWRFAIGERLARLGRRPVPQLRLQRHPQKRMAIMVPAWREDDVIATMLANAVSTFDYDAYDLFVGVYANDPDTRREVEASMTRFPNVRLALVPHDGPTSKADCLNWIIQNILAHEAEHGVVFDVFVMHDAEDVVHPFGLRAVNWHIEGQGMIQLPVLSMDRRLREIVACHYMDEFAEFHGKDLRVRSRVAGMTPSAGVATAFAREAMLDLCREKNNLPFNTDSLTEDYDVGHRLKAMGHSSRFVRCFARTLRYRKAWLRKGEVQVLRRELVATKEFFPDRWTTSVRQKARWMLGVTYMGWRQLGWFGSLGNRYFLFRDRKGLITAPVGVLGYVIALQFLIVAALAWVTGYVVPPLVDQPWMGVVFQINLVFLLNRIFHRFWFTLRNHGLKYALTSPPRIVVSNLVGFLAFCRSLRIFTEHTLTGKPIVWDKTAHAFPSMSQIAQNRGRTGDVLRFWNLIEATDLDTALAAQRRRPRPLGLQLLDDGAVEEGALARAFAQQNDTRTVEFDPFALPAEALALLTPREAGRFAAIPLSRAGRAAEIALGEPLSRADREELEKRLAERGVREPRYLFARLSDVGFAVRYAWTPDALVQARSRSEALRREGLLDAEAEARLWRSVRASHARLGDLLVRAGALTHDALLGALKSQPADRLLGEHLVGLGRVTPDALAQALERQAMEPLDLVARASALGLVDPDRLGVLEPS